MTKPPRTTLEEAIRIVSEELPKAEAEVGSYHDDPRNFHARHRAEMDRLALLLTERVGAQITSRWDGARVRIAGVASTSTTGIAGALHNWIVAARKRAARG